MLIYPKTVPASCVSGTSRESYLAIHLPCSMISLQLI
jgi:hypothetical protein